MALVILLLPVFLYWKICRSAREQIKKITIGCRTIAEELEISLKSAANSARVVVLLGASFVPLLAEDSDRTLADKFRILTKAASFCFWNSCANSFVYLYFAENFEW